MTKKISGRRRPLIGLDNNNKQQKNQCSLLSANLTLPKHFCDQSLSGAKSLLREWTLREAAPEQNKNAVQYSSSSNYLGKTIIRSSRLRICSLRDDYF